MAEPKPDRWVREREGLYYHYDDNLFIDAKVEKIGESWLWAGYDLYGWGHGIVGSLRAAKDAALDWVRATWTKEGFDPYSCFLTRR